MRLYAPFLFLGVMACSEYELSPKAEADEPVEEVASEPEDTGAVVVIADTGDPLPPTDSGDPPSCDDFIPPIIGGVARDEDCLREPAIGTFTPVVEWQWADNPILPAYNQIMAAPAIGNLNDDNGDGRIDEDDIPDVVFTSFSGGAYSSAGAITAIRGDDGTTLWSTTSPGGHGIYSSSGVAIADLEQDGSVEVCVSGTSHSVVCLNGVDGSLKWAAGTETSTYGCPSIADLDADGRAEVILGRTIISSDGTHVVTGTGGTGGSHYMSFAVDWDGDGALEVIAGNTIYEADGSVLWSDGLNDAAPAVGDFNGDGRPDLVRAGGGQVIVTLNDGTLLWSMPTAGGGSAGAPTVADFDRDGLPEVGVADLSRYTAYDTDGTVMWSNTVSDYSSSKTGSAVFDFEGDGAAEIVYADEHTLWIFDGSTGSIKMAQDGHASGTLMEYPLIADVDRDGSTEIVIASNDYTFPGRRGITVIGDADQSWAPARPVWNQYAYHITNINNDSTVPRIQIRNWESWNNFRTGGTELGPSNWQPDLMSGEPSICTDECDIDAVEVYLPVLNRGLIEASDVVIVIERTDGDQVDVKNVPVIADGAGAIVGPIRLNQSQWGTSELFASVDWPETIDECREDNNIRALGTWPCSE